MAIEETDASTIYLSLMLVKSVLPLPQFDLETTVEIVDYYQRRHEAAAYLSHQKRRLALLEK